MDTTGGHGSGGSTSSYGAMFIRRHHPSVIKHQNPVVFIHSDHNTGKIWDTKPDGNPGWVSDFNKAGFMVYAPDLPFYGESGDCDPTSVALGLPAARLTAQYAEAVLTAPEKCDRYTWEGKEGHKKWPGVSAL